VSDVSDDSNQKSSVLERSRFSLADLPKAERFDIWKESVSCIYDVDIKRHQRKEEFSADISTWRHGDLLMSKVESGSQTFTRNSRMIAADGLDHYNIQLYTAGMVKSDTGQGGEVLKPGGLLLLDLSQDTEAQSSDGFNSLHLFLPRRLIEDKLTHPDDHNLRFMSERDPLVKMLHEQIVALNRYVDQLDDTQIAVLQETIALLLTTCLNTASQGAEATQALRHDISKLVRIRRYFRDNLLASDLSAEKAARDLGVSRSSLYSLFQHQGGVMQYLRDMRLKHAYHVLSNPMARSRSIYDIALECGYSSDTGFIRAFRLKYGVTPGDVRSGGAQRKQETAHGQLDRRFESWLRALD
jgi:AraC-like DNA-binding protein